MSKVVTAARQALVRKCLELGVSDHLEISKVATQVASSCGRQQVAGIKAHRTGSPGWNKKFLSFKEAREFARSLGLKTQKEWVDYCKGGKKPDGIPVAPLAVYKGEWKSWGDWMGTGHVARV